MPDELRPADRAAIEDVVSRLETAWNTMDGAAYSEPFAADADYVTIRGEHERGRPAIAAGHTAIFRSIYAGSTVRLKVESARALRPDVALTHVQSVLDSPQGPLKGRHESCLSLVLTRDAGAWVIASLHNTVKAPRGP